MKVISLIGRARSGKDTTADYLIKELTELGYQVQREALATPLKVIVADLLGISLADLEVYKNNNVPVDGYNVRKLLQDTADSIREKDTYYFANLMMAKIKEAEINNIDFFIITDTRLLIEQEVLKDEALFIKIIRPEAQIDESGHNTEIEVDKLYVDETIYNNKTINRLHQRVDQLIYTLIHDTNRHTILTDTRSI